MKKLDEVYIAEIQDYYLKNHTLDGSYLVFFNPNQDGACPEIEKRLGFQISEEDELEICIIRFEDYKSACLGFAMIADLDVAPEVWINGRKKKKSK